MNPADTLRSALSALRSVLRPPSSVLRSALPLALAVLALGISQPAAHANGTPYYLDVNGNTPGFGTPSGTYNLFTNSVWSTDPAGASKAVAIVSTQPSVQWTFGAPGLDFAGTPPFVFTINANAANDWFRINGLAINSPNANITLSGDNKINDGAASQTWSIASGSTLTVIANYGGIGGMNWGGSGALNFTGGGTLICASVIGAVAGGSTLTFSGPVVNLQVASTSATINMANYTLTAGALNFATTAAAAAFSIYGNNNGVLTISGGAIDNTSGSAMTLDLKGGQAGQGTINLGGNFIFTGSDNLDFGATPVALTATPQITVASHTLAVSGIINGGGFGLTKAGAGTLTLSGVNTYTGATTVNGGLLVVNGSLASGSAVAVGSGAILGGTGTINGSVTVNAGGTLAPTLSGANGGTLTLAGATAPTFNAGSTLKIRAPSGTPDKLSLTSASPVFACGNIDLVIDTTGLVGSVTGATIVQVAKSSGGISGTFHSVTVNKGRVATVHYNAQTITVDLSAPVAGLLEHFAISGISSPQTAGTAISGITITAQDYANGTVTSFTNTATYGGTAGVTGTSGAFTAGVLSGVSVTPTVAGSGRTLTVAGSGATGTNTFTVNAGAVSAAGSTVTAFPASVAADGAAASTISVTLKDTNNNPVPGKTVTLASSRPTKDTISAASGASATNGLVTFTVTSVTNGSSVFTATDTTDGNLVLTPTAAVTFTNSSAKAILTCSFGALGAATIFGTNPIIHVSASQPVTSLAPTFTVSPAATLSPVSGSANNFSSPVTYTVTAQDGSIQRYLVSVQPDPAFTLTVSTNLWDGRQTLTVTPNISNWSALVAAGATNLNYSWSAAGVAVIKQINPGSLTLLRSQGSGLLTVTLVLDNGGALVTNTAAITVQEPAADAWVVRTPDTSEQPVNNQFYARDDTGYGTIYYNGTSPAGTNVFLNVYTNGPGGDVLYTNMSQALPGNKVYALSARIKAGLVKYTVRFGYVNNGTAVTNNTVTNLVCGDAYIIDGQSNAVADNYLNDTSSYTNILNYSSPWIRSYGSSEGSPAGGWGNAVAYNPTTYEAPYPYRVGIWGFGLASNLVATYQIPVCVINEARGATRIDQHLPNPTNHYASSIYGDMLNIVTAARLTHGIRGVLWHQGESDGGFNEAAGNPYWVTYQQTFVDMAGAWKQDYPNLRCYYIFQIWGGAMLLEVQRNLPRLYSHMSIMSTVGVVPGPQVHYPIAGYLRMAQLMSPLVAQDNYGYVPTTPITAPDLKRAYFTTTNRTEIALEFGQDMVWNAASTGLFFLDGVAGKVASGSASGNVVKLQVTGASTSQKITYLGGTWDGNQANILYGSNGIAALTFWAVPIAASGSAVSLINSSATGVSTNAAVPNGTLMCSGTNYGVVAYWGTADGGMNPANWTNSAYVGAWTNVASTNISYPVTGLALNTTYYFTFRGTNAGSNLWASPSQSFTTLAPPSPPRVDNAVGAANLSPGVAQLRGMLTNGPADVRLYWGTTDGGTTPASWANTNLLAGQGSGAFAGNVSNLLYGLTYYYRAFASNQHGTAWAPATAAFTTLKPVASAAVQIPYSSLVEVAASSAYNGYPATNAFNGAGLAGDGTHSTSGSWLSTSLQPVAYQWLKVRFDQSYALDHLRVWAFNQSVSSGVTNADVYVLNSATDSATNVDLGGGPFKTNGWSLWLTQQPFKPSAGGTETNTDPNLSLGGVNARQLALKINNVVSGNYAGFAEIQIYQLPSVLSLANSAATGVAATTVALNATLACTGSVYRVDAFWNTVNGGTDAGLWTNSAYIGSWTNVALTNLSLQVSGLSPASTYYFTFRATNAVDTLWATNVQSFTTLASTTPPTPALPGSAITFSNGAPTFTFGTVAGYKYRLDYKNALLDATWQPVIAPPNFPAPYGWSITSTGGNMSLSDTNTASQSQRFYRLESGNP